jgi:hypothetical protein
VVGGATNSVTFTDATITAGGHATSGSPTLTGAGGLVAIGAAQSGDDGGTITLAEGGAIVTAGEGKVTVGPGFQIGGTEATSFDAASGGDGGVIIEATDSTTTITQANAEAEDFLTLDDAENGIMFAGLSDSAAVITLTASVDGDLPVVFSGTDVIVPASTENNSAGAILDISEKVSILLGTTSGSLKFQKGIASGTAGSGSFIAADNATITATNSGSEVKLPAAAGFGATLGTDGEDTAAGVAIATSNSEGVWTLTGMSADALFASEASEAEAVEFAVIEYATVLVGD